MNNDSKTSIPSIVISRLTHKIKCHSSEEVFCEGDICFIEYPQLAPSITKYGCIELDKTIDDKCNKTINFIHRECCSTTFCNFRLFNHNFDHHWSILNASSINDNNLFHTRLRIVLNIIMAILLFGILCSIIIYLSKQRIKSMCKTIRQRTTRSRKLQPSILPSPIIHDSSNNNIIHMSPCSPRPIFSVEGYSSLSYHNNNNNNNSNDKLSDII